ncbi:transcriptional regulator [Methanobrevibacter sp. TMH8]|uniref:transcriptional regulator n=1 Tax=Methanobrevibacter sp. TMH8 TaxID=2848611 RepID=UPI001CCFE835|nr:transcriptional regulator [Methanobrevibacter sp. TMH8]MBZ9570589.1 transcriptional regulator [Methanobrevibacter sp. TMH8]
MKEKLDDELIDLISYVQMSSYREKILIDLMDKIKTPSKLSKSTEIKMSHISTVLKELKDKKLIECLNPKKRQGRLYTDTELGKKVLKYIE